MGYGKGMVKSDAMGAHKEMAGAKSSFGVKSAFTGGVQTQPGVKSFEAMQDSMRGAPPAVGGKHMGMQAAPDHGDMGKDHFSRGGMV